MDLSKNPFLDKEYFDRLNDFLEIRNITGRYKKVWDRQDGKCFICQKSIKLNQDKKIIYKELNNDTTFRNLAYIHEYCEDAELVQMKCTNEDFNNKNVYELIKDIEKLENKKKEKKKTGKFDKLTTYFHNVKKIKVTLKFADIEKIIGIKLCKSAYKYKSYFYNHSEPNSIANSWTSQGYKIVDFDLENQKIFFEKDTANKPRVILPEFLFNRNLPKEAKQEIEIFFEKIKDKYSL